MRQATRERRALRAHVQRMAVLYRIDFPADIDAELIGQRQQQAVQAFVAAADDVVASCRVCGCQLTRAEWDALPLLGRYPDGLELKACPTAGCRNTLAHNPGGEQDERGAACA